MLALALLAAASLLPAACALPPLPTRKGVLLWQVQLRPDQCGAEQWNPCYNVYAVNETHGDLVWFAFTTASAAIKGMEVGHHSVYYTTWSGPGLYAINAGSGHVRWQFPLDNWFRYWIKDIDLDRSASFAYSAEVRDVVYVTAAGPPARLYGLRTRSGSRQWEFMASDASAVLADLTGPLDGNRARAATVFLAMNLPSTNSSWLQALDTCSGKPSWQSQRLNNTLLDRLELQGRRLLATSAGADAIMAFDVKDGSPLWVRNGSFCELPSPIANMYDQQLLLLAPSCSSLSGLTAVSAATGQELWSGGTVPAAVQPVGNCSSYAVAYDTVFFGCSCSIKAEWHLEEPSSSSSSMGGSSSSTSSSADRGGSSSSKKTNMDQSSSSSSDIRSMSSSTGVPGATAARQFQAAGTGSAKPAVASGTCMYALSTRSGKLRWVLPVVGNATVPDQSQVWGMAPVVHGGLVVLLATDQLLAADAYSGKLRWTLQLPPGEVLQAFQQPVVDADSDTLLLASRVQGTNKTGLLAVSLREGKQLWHKTVNGTAQPALMGPAAGAQQLMVDGGRLYVEACRGSRCCLRALNVSTGKQHWGMCLDAVQGDDATHPHAQFAIWLITLITIGSIALLILGACLVYVQRWSEERRILYGGGVPGSPRHSYQPLPASGHSDSEDGDQR